MTYQETHSTAIKNGVTVEELENAVKTGDDTVGFRIYTLSDRKLTGKLDKLASRIKKFRRAASGVDRAKHEAWDRETIKTG